MIGFIWFCERHAWFPRNYATEITRGLSRIEVKPTQTGYFQPHEYKAIVDATYLYSDRPKVDRHNSLAISGHRIRALTELMRWTGLRVVCRWWQRIPKVGLVARVSQTLTVAA